MKIDFAHLVTKFLVKMIMFCVFMFVFTERGGGVVRTRPKKRLNPDELRSFNISMSKETKLLDVLRSSFSMIFRFLKGWLAIAKLKPHSLFVSLILMLKKAFDN